MRVQSCTNKTVLKKNFTPKLVAVLDRCQLSKEFLRSLMKKPMKLWDKTQINFVVYHGKMKKARRSYKS